MSVRWDVKWCTVSRKTNTLAHKRPFHWISMKIKLERVLRENSKFQNWSLLTNSCRRYNVVKHYTNNRAIHLIMLFWNYETYRSRSTPLDLSSRTLWSRCRWFTCCLELSFEIAMFSFIKLIFDKKKHLCRKCYHQFYSMLLNV